MHTKAKSGSIYDWQEFGGITNVCSMHVSQCKSKIKNIQEVIQQPVLNKVQAMWFDLSGAIASLMMLADVRVETEVTITNGKASTKYKTRSDQVYLVPIDSIPCLLTTVPLHTIAKSVITNADLLNEEYEQMDVLESISKFVVSEANYRKEGNVPAIWQHWIFFW